MNIAIIGAGVSGSSLLAEILDHPNYQDDLKITIYDGHFSKGHGQPFRQDDLSILLNNHPEGYGAFPNDPDGFVDWLKREEPDFENKEKMYPRPFFGAYLREAFSPYLNHPSVKIIEEDVIELTVLDKEGKLADHQSSQPLNYRVNSDETIYEAIFFCFGHPPYSDYYDLIGKENYVHKPYPADEKLSQLENKQKIAILGTGASSIDMMRYILSHYELDHPLTFYDLPNPFNVPEIFIDQEAEVTTSFSLEWLEKNKLGRFVSLDKVIETVQSDLSKHGLDFKALLDKYFPGSLELYRQALETNDQDLAIAQVYASNLTEDFALIYNSMSKLDQDKFDQEYAPAIDSLRGKIPQKSFLWLLEEIDQGRVEVVTGIQEIEQKPDLTFELIADQTYTADIIINTTGFETNLLRAIDQDPLLKNLYDQKIIQSYENGQGILVDWPYSRLMNTEYGLMQNAFLTGIWIGNLQYPNNDARPNLQQGRRVGKYFMDYLYKKN